MVEFFVVVEFFLFFFQPESIKLYIWIMILQDEINNVTQAQGFYTVKNRLSYK